MPGLEVRSGAYHHPAVGLGFGQIDGWIETDYTHHMAHLTETDRWINGKSVMSLPTNRLNR